MATSAEWHDRVTASIGGAEQYGKGILPNPYFLQMEVHKRRHENAAAINLLTSKIEALSEPRFHTGSETSELMESLITMISATQILELGTHTGRSTLHFLRAVVGIPGAKVVSIDARPTHDVEFFAKPEIAPHFQHLAGWTPETLKLLHGRQFDFVFVDSAHDIEHTQKEVNGLLPITHAGSMLCFHDCPQWQTPANQNPVPVRQWLEGEIKAGRYTGMMLPSPRQLDCVEEYGADYDTRCSPGLAILIRR